MDAINVGASVSVFPIGGISITGSFKFPGIVNEPVDLGIKTSLSPGFLITNGLKLINPNNPFADSSVGVDFFKTTLNIGYDWSGQTTTKPLSVGVGSSVYAGVGSHGIGASYNANQSTNLPTGVEVNIGPQLRAGGSIDVSADFSLRNTVNTVTKGINNILSSNTQSTNGGIMLYPNTSNTNTLTSIYKK